MLTHVFDTSAWIAHLRNEPGSEAVDLILSNDDYRVGISALSLLELYARLRTIGREREFEAILVEYRWLFAKIAPVDEDVAMQAIVLRQNAAQRLPTVDSMIAATAATQNAILVHRDPHFQTIPEGQLQQLVLAAPQ